MTDIESPLYRVNRFVAAVRVCTPAAKLAAHVAGAFELTVADLEAVVRENYDLREREAKWRPMDTAPKTGPAKDILLACQWGGRKVLVAHWAFGGGEEQPEFGPAWFFWSGYDFRELPRDAKPVGWMDLPTAPELAHDARAVLSGRTAGE